MARNKRVTSKSSQPTLRVAGLNPTASQNMAPKTLVLESDQKVSSQPLSEKEMSARREYKKVVTGAGGYFNNKSASAYNSGGYSDSSGGNFYSPQLSTDFLEKPQNLRERRAWYRHFYNANEIVGSAIDLHSTIPLSKIRLQKPKAKNPHLAEYSYRFFTKMCDKIKMLKTLLEMSHEYWLLGNCFAFAEDHLPYEGLNDDAKEALKFKGKVRSDSLLKDFGITDSDPNYTGITKIIVLPPDQVRVTKIPFADNPLIEYVPDPETKSAIARFEETHGQAFEGLSESSRPKIPESIRTAVSDGGALPLDTDPNTGSFVYHLARKKSQYEVMGVSILERCINTLLIKDKLRQAQTSIASRHMTPIRVVSGEQLSDTDVDDLRMQVDMALMDPDYSIISNYTINWEEYGSNQRLLELTTEYDHQDADLFAGLGVTKEMMTGEASYAGSKISMEILNIQYLLFRDMLQDYIEKHLFEPVARRKGFIETDEYGEEHVIYPKFSFTRMSLKDSDQAFEQAFQLYQKGSLPVDTILEFLGFDPELAEAQLKKDMFTVNDASFNALVQAAYQAAANDLVAKSDLTAKAADALGLKVVAAPPEGDAAAPGGDAGASVGGLRFASAEMKELGQLMANDPDGIQKVIQFLRKRNGKANTGS